MGEEVASTWQNVVLARTTLAGCFANPVPIFPEGKNRSFNAPNQGIQPCRHLPYRHSAAPRPLSLESKPPGRQTGAALVFPVSLDRIKGA